jgi:hypothetical protein
MSEVIHRLHGTANALAAAPSMLRTAIAPSTTTNWHVPEQELDSRCSSHALLRHDRSQSFCRYGFSQ